MQGYAGDFRIYEIEVVNIKEKMVLTSIKMNNAMKLTLKYIPIPIFGILLYNNQMQNQTLQESTVVTDTTAEVETDSSTTGENTKIDDYDDYARFVNRNYGFVNRNYRFPRDPKPGYEQYLKEQRK